MLNENKNKTDHRSGSKQSKIAKVQTFWPRWILLQTLGQFIRLWPMTWTIRAGAGLGWLIYLAGYRRATVKQNLALAYPQQPETQEAILKGFFNHLGCLPLEFLRNNALTRRQLEQETIFLGEEYLQDALSEGKGMLLLSGHFANWELGLRALTLKTKVYVTSKKLHQGWAQWCLEKQRKVFNMDIIYSGKGEASSIKKLLRASKEQACVLYVLDQHTAGTAGLRVNFFGVPAATSKGLASIALKTGMPVVPMRGIRRGDGKLEVTFYPKLPLLKSDKPDRQAAHHEEIFLNTQLYSDVLEHLIRKRPEQWLWSHRRWKADRTPLFESPNQGDKESLATAIQ